MTGRPTAEPAAPPPPLSPDIALFLDFDGTLAALQDNADAVGLPETGADILLGLSNYLGGALCLISGRDIRDLAARTPGGVWRAGGHGLEICAPNEAPKASPAPAPTELTSAIDTALGRMHGVRIEHKGQAIAVHYRAAPELRGDVEAALTGIIAAFDDYTLEAGKMIFEIKHTSANKGAALARIMQFPAFEGRKPVMFGDDATDEHAMIEAGRLGGYGVKIGEGETAAQYRLAGPDEVWGWLKGARDEQS